MRCARPRQLPQPTPIRAKDYSSDRDLARLQTGAAPCSLAKNPVPIHCHEMTLLRSAGQVFAGVATATVLAAIYELSLLRSACAASFDEAGFWPVISRPSVTTKGCQSAPFEK